MKKLGQTLFPFLLAAWIAIGCIPAAYALDDSATEFTLEEITITAEKRQENVQKTAMSVSAVSGDQMTEKAISDLQSALSGMAGVNIMGIPGGGQIYIRGVGSTLDANLGDPSVSVQKDNIYVGRVEAAVSSMYDMERVEVLRGPQGTMYGRNAAGGQINVISRNPTEKFEGNASLTIGDYNLQNFTTAVNIPLAEKLNSRIAINRETRDGYIDDGSDNADKFGARVKLAYEPTDNLSFLLTVEYSDDKSSAASSVPVKGSAGNLPLMGGVNTWVVPDIDNDGLGDDLLDSNGEETDGGNGIPDIVDLGWEPANASDPWSNDEYHPAAYGENEFQYYQLQINYDMGWGQFTLLPSLNKNSRDLWSNLVSGTSQGEGLQEQAYEEEQWTAEARLQNSDDSEFKWLIGVYWLDSDNKDANMGDTTENDSTENFTGEEDDTWATDTYRRPADVMAYYGQATYPVANNFRVTGGIRYTADDREMGYRYANYNITDTDDPYYDAATVTSDGRREYDSGVLTWKSTSKDITYRGGIEYDVNDSSMIYTYVTTGYKAGGLNLQGIPITSYDPEEVISYSIGSKNRFMDNRLQLNTEVYYYDYTGYQYQCYIQVVDAYTGDTVNRQLTLNSGDSFNYGLEIETDYLITSKDKISATFAYMKAEYGKGSIPASPFYAYEFELDGRDMANTPRYSGTIGYEHTWSLDTGALITGKLDSKITSGYWTTHEQYYPGAWQESYHMSNFYLTYYAPTGNYNLGLWSKNLENEDVTTRVLPMYRRVIMSPRTFGVTLSVKF